MSQQESEEQEIQHRQAVLKEEQYQKERQMKVKAQQQRAEYAEARLKEKRAFDAAKEKEKKAKGPSFFERAAGSVKKVHLENDLFDEGRPRRKRSRKKKKSRKGGRPRGSSRSTTRRRFPSGRGHGGLTQSEYYEYLRLKRRLDR